MNKPIPKVGQTLYSLNVGNAARRTEQKLTPVIVRKVGRKYFECSPEDWSENKTVYHLDNWQEKTEGVEDSCLYQTEQEWLDEQETVRIYAVIRNKFETYGRAATLSLDKLRRIKEIIES